MMNNINVGSSTLRAQTNNRGFYWPTTSFLINEEEKKRRIQRSPRRMKSMDDEQHKVSTTSNNVSRAAQRREQFRKTPSKSQDSYFNKTIAEESPSSPRAQEIASTYSPSTIRRVCSALSIQRHSSSKSSHKSTTNTTTTTTPTSKNNKTELLRRQNNVNKMSTSSLPLPLRKLGFLTRRKHVQQEDSEIST